MPPVNTVTLFYMQHSSRSRLLGKQMAFIAFHKCFLSTATKDDTMSLLVLADLFHRIEILNNAEYVTDICLHLLSWIERYCY